MDETSLIIAARQGDKDAFGELISSYQTRVFNLALFYTRNREDAMDVAQEVFIRVYRYLGRFNIQKAFFPWMYSIIRNTLHTFYQRRKTHQHAGSDFLELMEIPDHPDVNNEDKLYLIRAIDTLPDLDKELILLKYFEGLGIKEIAEISHLSESNIKIRLMRAREKIKVYLIGEEMND